HPRGERLQQLRMAQRMVQPLDDVGTGDDEEGQPLADLMAGKGDAGGGGRCAHARTSGLVATSSAAGAAAAPSPAVPASATAPDSFLAFSPRSLPCRCSSAARMKPLKRGCGANGLLLKSGCAWQPMKKGWSGSSTISTRPSSGFTPLMRRPPCS